MSEVQHWSKQTGMLWMERDGLRLIIHLPPAKGYVRFAVIDHYGPDHHLDRLPAVIGRDRRLQTAEGPEQSGRVPAGSEVSPKGSHS
jgi:hypothetical protein